MDRTTAVSIACVAGAVLGFLTGNHSGRLDMAAFVGVMEDGSYSAGCLPGAPCEKGD